MDAVEQLFPVEVIIFCIHRSHSFVYVILQLCLPVLLVERIRPSIIVVLVGQNSEKGGIEIPSSLAPDILYFIQDM